MTCEFKRTVGVTCKACNRSLDSTDADGELCGTCLRVVHELNHRLYEDYDVEEDGTNDQS
jgi:hypothetical protein